MQPDNPMKKNIKKIVYVMFENRSFDNTLGWLYDGEANPEGVNYVGSDTPFQGLTEDLCQEFAQPIPYRLERWKDGKKPIVRGVQKNYFPCHTPFVDPEETFANITQQIYSNDDAEGAAAMLGFLQNYYDHKGGDLLVENEILDTYDNHQLPILNTLAREYGVSDEWFASIPSQTSINRAFSICGDSVGLMHQDDKSTTAMVNNHYWDHKYRPAQFVNKTIWEVLTAAGYDTPQDWKFYYSDKYLSGNFGYKRSYSYYLFRGLQDLLEKHGKDPHYQNIDSFYDDAAKGTLPKFSCIEPKYTIEGVAGLGIRGNDYHPPGDVESGEQFLSQLYTALKFSPDWEHTLFIVAWDEHGGTFDHVSPPDGAVNPCEANCYEADFKFNRFGVRVPMLFISPWVQPQTVIRSGCKTPFDYTSWLATLLDWFDLPSDASVIGSRVADAPKFDGVISDVSRNAVVLPEPWDCESASLSRVSIDKAAEIARVMATHVPDTDSGELLKESLQHAHTEEELAHF